MKLKKYGKGGKYDMYKKGGTLRGKKVTKEMADKEFKKKFEESANFANKFAKYAETGVGPNGMPLSAKKRKEYADLAKSYKSKSSEMKPNYRYVGTKLPAKDQPVYKKGGKVNTLSSKKEAAAKFKKRALEFRGEKPKGYSEKPKKIEGPTLEERQAERKAARKAMSKYKMGGKLKKYLKGGQAKLDANKDGKISGEDFKMLRAKKKK